MSPHVSFHSNRYHILVTYSPSFPLLHRGAQVLVDGAHALGSLSLSLRYSSPNLTQKLSRGVKNFSARIPSHQWLMYSSSTGRLVLITMPLMPISGSAARRSVPHDPCLPHLAVVTALAPSVQGCGFLYVHKTHQGLVRPLLVSHGYDSGFSSSFVWSGQSVDSTARELLVSMVPHPPCRTERLQSTASPAHWYVL